MKIKSLLTMMFVLCACAACNDDKNEETPLNQVVAGKYDGYTKAVAQYFPAGQYADKQSITLTPNDNGTVNIAYTSESFGEFSISNATVELKNDAYLVKGDGKTTMGMNGGTPKEYDCTFEGTISKDKKTSALEFNVPAVMNGLTVTFTQGEAPAAVMAAGSYKGYTKAVAQYFPNGQYAADQTIKVTANEDGTVNVTYTSTSFGEFTINNATVKSENNVYTINGEGKSVMGMEGKEPKEYACTLKGTIDAAKATPTFEISVPAVMNGLTITFATGDVPEIK